MSAVLDVAVAGLPGIALRGRPAAPRPDRLLAPGVLLLADANATRPLTLDEHRVHWHNQPLLPLDGLITAAASVNLVGAGGAAFPTARKLASMRGERVSQVVVNGSEGESASAKDGVLLFHVPHLVLDGAVATAKALGTKSIVVRVAADRPHVMRAVQSAIAERRDGAIRIEVSSGPADFVAGEATAVIRALSGGPALPADLGRPPRTPRRGPLRGNHVFLSNVETFARLAVVSRGDQRTSALITVSGAVHRPGVLEIPSTMSLADVAQMVGLVGRPRLVISGGWHGAWVPWSRIADVPLRRAAIAEVGGRWGAGAFVVLPDEVDPREVLAAIAGELAGESSGQCGPCVLGLPQLAQSLNNLQRAPGRARRREVDGLLAEVDGRGLCAHPTATAAAVRSGLAAIDAIDTTKGSSR